ncbi:expressed protein [Phakopsora pachyrhizi]|uniref:Expressed protein n=1 Tax=Phakopsora pachyrhizi TaxID=170000 RepID=A0AAV0AZN3_PHAPC|nr:expressed protein [Phakopsora pachyrhizi]
MGFFTIHLNLALREEDECWLSSRTNFRPSSALVFLFPVFNLTIIGLRFYLGPSSFVSQSLFMYYFLFYLLHFIFLFEKNLIAPSKHG